MMGECKPSDASQFHIALLFFVVPGVPSELGIAIGPLLAGARIVGLAASSGAQCLVKGVDQWYGCRPRTGSARCPNSLRVGHRADVAARCAGDRRAGTARPRRAAQPGDRRHHLAGRRPRAGASRRFRPAPRGRGATGPVDGLSVTVKESFNLAGSPTGQRQLFLPEVLIVVDHAHDQGRSGVL